ncbi:MAG: hypothetical protein NC410_00905 [Oscillibacter sp.]|nr:hypothetical protein [Oscillibacter sp.]
MKKLFYLLLVVLGATMFTACSDDDDKDNSPMEGYITKMTMEEPDGASIYEFEYED